MESEKTCDHYDHYDYTDDVKDIHWLNAPIEEYITCASPAWVRACKRHDRLVQGAWSPPRG
jgi:hypothetical protein